LQACENVLGHNRPRHRIVGLKFVFEARNIYSTDTNNSVYYISSNMSSKKSPAAPTPLGWGRYFVRGNSELNSEEDKERLLLVVHWIRQLLALCCGVLWGLSPLSGFIGLAGYVTRIIINPVSVLISLVFISFMVINLGAVYFYYNKYLMLDETEFETKDLLQEGLMPSFASFLVSNNSAIH
jgi:hypothetical protein